MTSSIIVVFVMFICCCRSNAFKIQARIVDGQTAKIGEFPYYAYLDVRRLNSSNSGCGASIISAEWLISASHCLTNAHSVSVHVGEYLLNKPIPGYRPIVVEPKGFFIHPQNDIALIKLPQKLSFSIFVQPIRFTSNCYLQTDIDVIAVGHGKTSDKSDVSIQLKYANLRLIPLKDCARLYPDKIVSNSYICAKSSSNDYQSTCGGDSGGPLITKSDKKLIGISAFITINGCETGMPQGFTNVHLHLRWVELITGETFLYC